jgi:hypothetical protein
MPPPLRVIAGKRGLSLELVNRGRCVSEVIRLTEDVFVRIRV